jgi:hypothetical protein
MTGKPDLAAEMIRKIMTDRGWKIQNSGEPADAEYKPGTGQGQILEEMFRAYTEDFLRMLSLWLTGKPGF